MYMYNASLKKPGNMKSIEFKINKIGSCGSIESEFSKIGPKLGWLVGNFARVVSFLFLNFFKILFDNVGYEKKSRALYFSKA